MAPANESGARVKLEPANFFALRTPLLPFDEILEWTQGCQAAALNSDAAHLDELLAADRNMLRSELRGLLERPEIREALFLASPDLSQSIPFWLEDPISERGQRIEKSVVRYVQRMASRPTPFGLFAGCSVGRLGTPARLELAPRQSYRRHTRLDADYLFALADSFQRQPSLGRSARVRPNSSLYRAAGRFRYAEAKVRGKERSYQLVAVDDSDYLRATLERAHGGAQLAELAAALVAQDPDITLEEAEAFIDELIGNQVLVTELEPTVTGPEPTEDLLAELQGVESCRELAETLASSVASLQAFDEAGLGVEPLRYQEIARGLESLPARFELSRLFQVDTVKPVVAAALSERVVEEIIRGLNILQLLGRWSTGPTSLARFREAFVARYEGREVPLVEALDEELGVPFESASEAGAEATPLLAEIDVRPPLRDEAIRWEGWQSFLVAKLDACARQRLSELSLTPDDLERLSVKQSLPLPDAFSVQVVIAADSPEALAQGKFELFLPGAHGPSGARVLGRFCHADPELHRLVRGHLRAEEALDPEALFAEVVHLPDGRAGNVVCRPVLRDYEVPFLGRSGAPLERQLPITDLLVSIQGERIVLRSRRLGRRLIPRLSTAQNYHARSLRLYKFLCDLQDEGSLSTLGWEWGLFKHARFLPRIRVGRLVFARACWRLDHEELRALAKQSGTALFRAVQALRRERGLPRWVLYAEHDQELLVDFDNVLSVETLIDTVKAQPRAMLFEMFPGPERLAVCGPEGRFTHEIIIPFTCKKEATRAGGTAVRSATVPAAPRTFIPGSDWLYAKLYTGAATADQVLRDVVAPVTRQALACGHADGWFFLRYRDPDCHLRWRLHGAADALRNRVMQAVAVAVKPLLEDGRIRKVQHDTYEREEERYGGPVGIGFAERIFQIDSEAVLAIVERFSGDAGVDARWRLCLRGMDLFLEALGLSWSEKRAIVKSARLAFAENFPAEPQSLGKKFRAERASLAKLLDPEQDEASPLAAGLEILRRSSERLAPIAAELRAAIEAGRVTVPLPALGGHYIHLHANRLLRSAQRAQESVLYFFLDRLYESREAQQNRR